MFYRLEEGSSALRKVHYKLGSCPNMAACAKLLPGGYQDCGLMLERHQLYYNQPSHVCGLSPPIQRISRQRGRSTKAPAAQPNPHSPGCLGTGRARLKFLITPDPPNQSTHDRSFVSFFSALKKVSKWTKNLWLDSLLEEVFIGSPLDTGSNLLLVEAENLTLGPDKSACFGLSC